MSFDLYAWQSPRDIDEDAAEALLRTWHEESGGDPARSPFAASTDVGWFYRELVKDAPGLEVSSDAVPNPSTKPIWLSTEDEPPARVVGMRVSAETAPDDLEAILGLAAKYDLVLYDTRSRRIHLPLDEMAAHASATFWPAGAIQAGIAGALGGGLAAVAWILGVPVLSGVVMVIGGFLIVMAVLTFLHEGRNAARARGSRGE